MRVQHREVVNNIVIFCVMTDDNYIFHGEHFVYNRRITVMHLKTNIILYSNYNEKKKKKGKGKGVKFIAIQIVSNYFYYV